MDKFINIFLHYTINKFLRLFNRSLSANTIYYIINTNDDWRVWIAGKDYFEISYNFLSKTNDKYIYKIDKQIRIFKYKFKRK